jgi:hypothetical protein
MSGNNQNNLNNIIDVEYLTPQNAEFLLSENGFLQLKATVKIPENILEAESNPEKSGGSDDDNKPRDIFFERVFLHRAFPFENPFEYIAVSGNFPKTEKELEKERKEKEEREAKEKKEKEEKAAKDLAEGKKPEETKDEKDGKDEKKDNPPKENTTSLGDLKEIGIIRSIELFSENERRYITDELNRKYFVPVIETIYSAKERYGYSYWDVKTNIGKIKFTVNDANRNIIKVSDDRILVTDVNGNRYEITSLSGFDQKSLRKIELYL